MSKFDVAKYWQFRVWVKSQIEQLRELVSEYQPSSGGGGDSDFDPDGAYPNMSVGKATTLASAPAISASGNGIAITAGGKTSSTLSLKTINGASIIGSGDIDTGGDFDPDGTYPNMSVGTATDLSGRIEASPAVFTYRPSAGDKSIKDDNAFIRRVKGNSIAWNQYATRIARSSGITFTYSNGVYELSGTTTGTYFNTANPANFVSGHKILLILDIVANPNNISFKYGDLNANAQFDINTTNHIIYTTPTTRSYNLGIVSFGGVGVDFSGVKIRQMWVDLTAMFGTGNEPTTVEEFRALYPNSYYPYNAGELRNLVCSGIKTVGFNEFNGTYARVLPNESYYLGGSYTSIGFAKELGGATETISIPSNRIYTPTQLGYIYATGTDICINLHHTGYRDGEYEPYKEVTHTLPLSQITNGEPLRKAGGEVYDEINETEYIRRVGVRGYATGDKDDATLLTDGIYTNYPLDEPIVKPIETPIDFNYYVEDFGTEEALLADDSAPFSADIVYQFNAVDNIRQNRISIQKLNDIFSGSKGEYVRADGSWGYIADLKGNFFVKPTLKRIRTGISELSDTIQIIHPYLTEHIGDAKIVLMAVKRRGGSYYDTATNAKGRRKKRKAWGELHYAAMPNTEINHNTIEMSNGASFEAWQNVILTACGRIPEGLENAREPYNVNVALEDLAEFFATNGAIFVGKTPVIRLGVALRIPNPNFIDYGNGNKMWDYNDVTGKWEYKYLYSDVAEVVVKSQMLRTGGYVLGLELV